VPVLIAYGQIGRYTMTDLQEDRSLLAQPPRSRRGRLRRGLGSPTRGDRWLTFEDYVNVYLNDCIEHICKAHDIPAINLFGICEGGVFSLCHAALNPGG
jgi:polyhydroxyalkanoate synthase